jgi:hypothetical protein
MINFSLYQIHAPAPARVAPSAFRAACCRPFSAVVAALPGLRPPVQVRDDEKLHATRAGGKILLETFIILLGLAVGVLVGLLGIGGGIVLVPALSYLLGFDQHMAQGTSLFLQLPPLGLGALYVYWRRGNVDWMAGSLCALGFLFGGFFGSHVAQYIPSPRLEMVFGVFLVFAAVIVWREASQRDARNLEDV